MTGIQKNNNQILLYVNIFIKCTINIIIKKLEVKISNEKVMEELNRSYLENKYGCGTLQSLREIDINEIGIETIESRTFKGLTQLKVLSLVNTQLTQIDGNLFDDLLNLIELWLYNNKLIIISSDTFSGLTSLNLVNLENNVIKYLEENCFENLRNLKKLMLNRNKLKIIRENTFKGLTNLKTLWLHENEIVMIDEKSFGTLLNLEFLWLGNNKLEEIKRNCFECLSSIKVIEVYENQFRALSFKKESIINGFNQAKLDENGFLSDWNKFLEQFPQLEKKCLKSDEREEEKDSDEDRDKLKFPIEKEKKDKKGDSFSKKGKKEDVRFESEKVEIIELNREYLDKKYGKDNLINLTSINISYNKIRKIDSNTFTGLTKLERLDLSNNKIEVIDVRLFESLSNLKHLDLSYNKLKRIESNTFNGLTKLEELSLRNNEIEEIDSILFENLSNLKQLYLASNKLKRIDSNTFNGLTKLEELWLNGNEIEVIEERLFETLSNLKELYLASNKLKRIDSNTFKHLIKLEWLRLDCNEIEEIDVRLFDGLSNLKQLWLSYNKLKRIDSNTFNGFTKLERLDLEHNEIEEIDSILFESLSNLKELDLASNKLKRIDSNAFNGLTKLETLELQFNEIEVIDVRLFESLSNLKHLDLSYNKLKRIDSDTFIGLDKLEELYLYRNEIEEIDLRSFETLSNLKKLDMSNNRLKEIDRKCFEPLKSIKMILIYENVGLNALSFIIPSTGYLYDEQKVEKYGLISEWNKFLQQFPQLARKLATGLVCKRIRKIYYNKTEGAKEIQDQYIGLFLIHRYEVIKKLGEGAFGTVYLVDDKKIDIEKIKKKAMKIMDLLDSTTMNELELFSEIIHENIVRYFDHFQKKIGGEFKTFLITEYCENGDLREKIEKAKRHKRDFDERQILDWIRQATNALKYLHSRKPEPIIHRDIKPENMFLSGSNEIKLGDLGLSKLMNSSHASSHAGTSLYMSPEVFKAQLMETKYYPNTDIWSLGCVLYELLFLNAAFPQGQRNNPSIPPEISTSGIFSSVLKKMLEKDFLVRITSERLFTELLNLSDDNSKS